MTAAPGPAWTSTYPRRRPWEHVDVLHTIVEGEPGIFPEPVARVMRKIGGWFDRRRPQGPAGDTTPAEHDAPSHRPGGDEGPPDDRSDGAR